MKIKVKSIALEGLKLNKSIDPSEIGVSEEEANYLGPIDVTVFLERIGNTIVVQAQVRGKLLFSCARCLEDVERECCDDFKFDYAINKDTELIDVGEDIRQEILLNMPLKVLCREDCRGICLHCGANLNEEQCRCSK